MRLVIALGGNALGLDPVIQYERAKQTAVLLIELIQEKHEIVITHGNGPQVGLISLALDTMYETSEFPSFELPEVNAMSEGYIGYHIQNALSNELRKKRIDKQVTTIVTEVVVNSNDPAFLNPTKPIGRYYNSLPDNTKYIYKKFPKGYRRVVPSPMPSAVIQKDVVIDLLNKGHIVITVGGGGIPVIENNGLLEGVSAVIDKDLASMIIANEIDADGLIILTDVDGVYKSFGSETAQLIPLLTSKDIDIMVQNNEFGLGSMLPKINASYQFVKNTNKWAIITSLDHLVDSVNNNFGTKIIA